MSNATGILGFPLYLVRVIPELKIEGQTVATGQPTQMGSDQFFEMTFRDAAGTVDQINNLLQAGEYHAIGLIGQKVSFQYLKDRADRWHPDTAVDRDNRLGELLYLIAMFYFANSDFLTGEAAKASDVETLRQPSASMVGFRLQPAFLFNIPVKVASVGLNIDVDRDIVSPVSRSNNSDTRFWFMITRGFHASRQEHALFESITGLDAISTVRFMELANSQRLPIYVLGSDNAQRTNELQIALQDKQAIQDALNAGKMVLVPKNNMQYFDYSGIGYHVVDLATGAGAYVISGGFNGGDTVKENVAALLEMGKELIGQNAIYAPYITIINNLLQSHPEIDVNSPNPAFKAFTERMLAWGDFAKRVPLGPISESFKLGVAYIILYNTIVMLGSPL